MHCDHTTARNLSTTGVCPLCATCEPAPLPLASLAQVPAGIWRAEQARRSFRAFAAGAWAVVEPARPLLPSVAFDAICAALQEAGERGGRWAISCPPGVSKSILCAVIFPAWLLLRSGGAARVMAGSYQWDFATRDARRCRDLMTSAWYVGLVGGAWAIRDDADRRDDYWTTAGGRRLVTSVSGKAIGERVDVQVLDDVLSSADVHSAAARKEAIRWVTEVLPSRLDDPEHATRILVGQRLHPEDPISVAVEQGWQHLVLPALATDEPCELRRADGSLIWRDDRAPGAPLFALLGVDALERLKSELGSAAFSAQYQQEPHDESSSMFRRDWLTRRWVELPDDLDREVIVLDASFKEGKASDFAVIGCWASKGRDRFLVEQWRKRAGFSETLEALKEMAQRHPFARVLVEAAANGHAIFEQISRELPSIFELKPVGGKLARAASVQAIVESGAVVLPANAPWVESFVDEVATFGPGCKNDDQVDVMAYALRELQQGEMNNVDRWRLVMGGLAAAKVRERHGLKLSREDRKALAARDEKIAKNGIPPRPVLGPKPPHINHDSHLSFFREQLAAWDREYGGGG